MSRCQDQRTKPSLSRPSPKLQDIGTRFWFMEWTSHGKPCFFDKLFVGHTRIHRIKAGWSWGTRGVGVRWSRWFSCWFWVILAIQEKPVCVCLLAVILRYFQWFQVYKWSWIALNAAPFQELCRTRGRKSLKLPVQDWRSKVYRMTICHNSNDWAA